MSHSFKLTKIKWIVSGLIVTLLSACQQGAPTVFDCKQLKPIYYPKIDAEADAWYQEALSEQNARRKRDYLKVAGLYQKAADKGHWKAMNNLARLYVAGLGVEVDKNKAAALLKQMQQYDIPEVHRAMAYAHENGIGPLRKSKSKMQEYMEKAAAFADGESVYRRGRAKISIEGRSGIPEATRMFECAMDLGYGKAGVALGVMYHGKQDYKRMYKTLIRGANMNAANCLSDLESAFRTGKLGLPKDIERAKCIDSYSEKFYEKGGDNYRLPDDIEVLCPANVDFSFYTE